MTDAIVVDQQGGVLSLVMFEKGDKDWSNSLNAQLLYEGLASLRDLEQEGGDIPDEVNDWYKIEEDAKE